MKELGNGKWINPDQAFNQMTEEEVYQKIKALSFSDRRKAMDLRAVYFGQTKLFKMNAGCIWKSANKAST